MDGKTQSKDDGARVEVNILGQRLMLKTSGDPRHVERLATYVKRKIDEMAAHGPVNSSKLAVLAAINIADDYFRALEESRSFKAEVASRSRGLLDDLNASFPE